MTEKNQSKQKKKRGPKLRTKRKPKQPALEPITKFFIFNDSSARVWKPGIGVSSDKIYIFPYHTELKSPDLTHTIIVQGKLRYIEILENVTLESRFMEALAQTVINCIDLENNPEQTSEVIMLSKQQVIDKLPKPTEEKSDTP